MWSSLYEWTLFDVRRAGDQLGYVVKLSNTYLGCFIIQCRGEMCLIIHLPKSSLNLWNLSTIQLLKRCATCHSNLGGIRYKSCFVIVCPNSSFIYPVDSNLHITVTPFEKWYFQDTGTRPLSLFCLQRIGNYQLKSKMEAIVEETVSVEDLKVCFVTIFHANSQAILC